MIYTSNKTLIEQRATKMFINQTNQINSFNKPKIDLKINEKN